MVNKVRLLLFKQISECNFGCYLNTYEFKQRDHKYSTETILDSTRGIYES